MDSVQIKSNLHRIIDSIEDNTLLNAVFAILAKLKSKTSEADLWDTLSKEQKHEIEEAIAELDRGEGIPHETVIAKFKTKWR